MVGWLHLHARPLLYGAWQHGRRGASRATGPVHIGAITQDAATLVTPTGEQSAAGKPAAADRVCTTTVHALQQTLLLLLLRAFCAISSSSEIPSTQGREHFFH